MMRELKPFLLESLTKVEVRRHQSWKEVSDADGEQPAIPTRLDQISRAKTQEERRWLIISFS
jgi:hypothetical protein